jgi:hypothetical protein
MPTVVVVRSAARWGLGTETEPGPQRVGSSLLTASHAQASPQWKGPLMVAD